MTTPLTDSKITRVNKFEDFTNVIHADHSRAIEERLNKCVVALEIYLMAGHKQARREASAIAKRAIANARKPL